MKRPVQFGALAARAAFRRLESLAHELLSSPEERSKRVEEVHKEIAEMIFQEMGKMRGLGLKLLQNLALEEDLIPKAYIEKFELAYGKAPALSRPVVLKVFKSEFGKPPDQMFSEFDHLPFAAASLGQVHRARLPSGEPVCVKIQYPNVAENMKSDLSFLKGLASTVGNTLIRNTVTELSDNFMAEIDYRIEAENIKFFRMFGGSEGVQIPFVFDELSTSKVLTMSYVRGQSLDCVKDAELKSGALQRIFDFFFHTLMQGQCVHADPHPGNFLIHADTVGVVDFGSVKKDIPKPVVELFLALMESSSAPADFVEMYSGLGATCTKGVDAFYQDHIREYHLLCSGLMKKNEVDFSVQRGSVSRLRKILLRQSLFSELQGLNPEFTMLHKSFQALLFLFCKFGAKISTIF